MLRQGLFNTALLQLFFLGMRMAPTAYLAQQIVMSRLGWDTNGGPILGDNEELICLYRLLDHTILLNCVLCLLYGTRDDNETPTGHKSILLRFWMLIAVMYSWGFLISTALGVDWVNWSLDGCLEIDLGQFTFVLFNAVIFFFVGRYMKQIEKQRYSVKSRKLRGVIIAKKVKKERKLPKLPKANPPQEGIMPGGSQVLEEIVA